MPGFAAGDWKTITNADQPILRVAGQEFVFPAHPARRWVEALIDVDPEEVLPGLLDKEDWPRWADIYFSPDWVVTGETHVRIVRAVITQAAGMPWWSAATLTQVVQQHWRTFDGWCLTQGCDPLRITFPRFCNLAYFWITQNADEKQRFQIDVDLSTPPPSAMEEGEEPAGWDESGAFAGMLNSSQGVRRSLP